MWPKYLDIDAKTCAGILRKLELEAYSSVVSALRAQGELTKERRKIMNDLSNILNISIERHKAEIRRAINDEQLNTIAAILTGDCKTEQEWAKEGRRIIPLLNRATPITAFSSLADETASSLASLNKSLPSPMHTKSEEKHTNPHTADFASKYSTRTPPKDLSEMVSKVKDEKNDENFCLVRTPNLSIQNPLNSILGGEVMVLPSGQAVRIHKDKLNEINEAIDNVHKNKRKRKSASAASELDITIPKSPAFEVLSKNALMNLMPPPQTTPKLGILGQHLMTSTPLRGVTPRGGRRGAGSRGGRRPRVPKILTPTTVPVSAPTGMGGPQQQQQHGGLAMLAQAINHQQEMDAQQTPSSSSSSSVHVAVPTVATVVSSTTTSATPSEPPQVAITPKKVVVVPTPSGEVLRTTSVTSTAASTISETADNKPTPVLATIASTQAITPTTCSVSQAISVTSTASITTTVPAITVPAAPKTTVKLKVGDTASPMKVFPVGTRILPKTATAGSVASMTSGITPGSSPIYMVATSVGQNLVRVARTTQTVTLTSGQRVVTVNTASLRPPSTGSGSGGTSLPLKTAIKTLQPRVVTSTKSPLPSGTTGSKPSVIVVQRSHGGTTAAKAILTSKEGLTASTVSGGQRILQTKTKQPIVIVSKPSSTGPIEQITTTSTTAAAVASSLQQPPTSSTNANVIVLDLGQEVSNATSTPASSSLANTMMTSTPSNNVLSDILQMTGIMGSEDETIQEQQQQQHEAVHLQQPRLETKTLKKVPGDSSWVVLDSNGSSNNSKEESQGTLQEDNIDIFSQAMASAEIDEFAANNIEITTEKEPEPNLITPKPTNSSIIFASPHDVMPQRPPPKLEDQMTLFSENNHGKSVVVEQVGDEIISESEVLSTTECDFST